MDPTAAIPVHFTLQAFGVATAGLLLAWSLVRRYWLSALGAAMLATGEALHAGRYLATDDDPTLVVLRFAGVALLSVAAVRVAVRRPIYIVGASAIVGGTVWGAAVGGGIANPSAGPHAFVAAGSILLASWAWLVSRDSVRLRVLTALVGMLAIAVVVGGGAVSRVAALDKRNEQLRQLGSAATAIRGELGETINGLARRAALLSPLVAGDLGSQGQAAEVRSGLQADVGESIAVVDLQPTVRAFVSTNTRAPPAYTPEKVLANRAVRSALQGTPATDFDLSDGRLVLLSSAPVYSSGGGQRPTDPLGAVAIMQSRPPEALREAARAYAPDAEIVLVGRTSAASQRSLLGVQPARGPSNQDGAERPPQEVDFERVETGEETRPVATTALGRLDAPEGAPSDDIRLVVVGSDAGTVDAATGLLRALLIAIVASALVAVVAALWLSARVTRPILDLAAGAEQMKADFLSSLSHELRTPLTPIRGYTELLRRGRVPARRAADYIDEIGDAAGRLERIVTLLLDVAALEAGRLRIDAGDPRPADVLGEAADRWKHRAQRHPVRVVAARSLPRVHADSDAIARVLDELIDNAMKFSPDGGVVELRARRAKSGVELSVADSGIGISPELAGELTGAFAQVESGDRRRFGGLGLGLTYVSGVLAAHGSRLTVTSEPGAGTTFSFTIPTAGMVSRMPAETAQAASPRQREAGTR